MRCLPHLRSGTALLLAACLTTPLLRAPSGAGAQVFARADDTRAKPPEYRKRPSRYLVELRVGGTYLEGNVNHVAINGALSVEIKLARRHELFLDGAATHALFDGESKLDKDKGSLLYVFSVMDHFNLYAQSTHSRNRFLKLEYRTTNSLGACVHGFGRGVLDPVLFSLGLTPENEWWEDTSEFALRATARLTFELPVDTRLMFGADLIYSPAITDFSDFRVFVKTYLEVKLWRQVLALRLTLADEFDSSPRPGVKKNDLSFVPALVVRIGK